MSAKNDATPLSLKYTSYASIKQTQGTLHEGTLEDLLRIHTETQAERKEQLPLIDLALYPGNNRRAGANPEAWTGLVLDYDDKHPTTLKTLRIALTKANLASLIHETASSTTEHPRFHVILPFHATLRDEVTRRRIFKWLRQHLPEYEVETENSKRAWFIGHLVGHASATTITQGWPCDVLSKSTHKLEYGFDRAVERQKVLDAGDGAYNYFVRLKGHLQHQDVDLETELRKEDDEFFDGHMQANHAKDFKRLFKKPKPVEETEEAPKTENASDGWEPYQASDLRGVKPEAPKFVLDGWLPDNSVTLLSGHGGTGKSFIALNLGLALAQGLPILGARPTPHRVLYMHCEDPRDVVHWRMSHYGLGYPENLLLVDGTKTVNQLYATTTFGLATATGRYLQLQEMCREGGIEVLILDGSSDFFGGNENDRAHVKAFVNMLQALCPCVLILAHVNKAMAQARQGDDFFSGSTAWHNSVRSRLALMSDDSGKVMLEVQKANWNKTGVCARVTWSDTRKVFELGEPENPFADVDTLTVLLLQRMVKWEAAGEKLYTSAAGRYTLWPLFKDDDGRPIKMKATGFHKILVGMRDAGYLRVDGNVFVITDLGRKMLEPGKC